MKNIFTIFALCLFSIVHSQQKIAEKVADLHSRNANFKQISVLKAVNDTPSESISNTVNKATLAKIDTETVSDIAVNKYENIEIEVPYQGNNIKVELYKVDLFSEGFHIDTDKEKSIAYEKGAYYRGIIKGDPKSIATFNFFKNEMNGIVSSSALTNLVVGKVLTPNNVSDYIIYSDAELKVLNTFNCAVKDDVEIHADETPNTSRNVATTRWVTMYFEIDYDLYQRNNNLENTNNWVTSVFNNVQTLYSNDGITVSLKSYFIWTEPDPYFGESSTDYLYQFNAVRPVFDGDVGILVGTDEGGLGGVAATIDGLCSQNGFSYADVNYNFATVPTYSWTVQVITHELGHLLGSPHTHACTWNGNGTPIDNCAPAALGANWEGGNCMSSPPIIPSEIEKGSIMSYCHLIQGVGISFANGFGPQPSARIINNIESSTCLSTDGVSTCINTISNIEVVNITNTSATFNWTDIDENATSWEVNIYGSGNSSTLWTTVTSPTFTTTQPLNPNKFYTVRIRPVCGNGAVLPFSRDKVFFSTDSWCNGIVITDTGNINGDYDNMESYVRTMIPNEPNKKVRLEFTEFNLELDYDYIYIYDGANTQAPLLAQLTGDTLPQEAFVSSAADGSLTLEFYSDQGLTAPGFVATVGCDTTLGLDNHSANIDFTYYPNPTNGFVNISSKTEMTDIAVYNITGQLLYSNKINGLDTKVDVSAFASGTYFFKLKFGDKQANFKIVKN